MLQSSFDTHPLESLSQLRIKICSVRLPSSSKLVDICVIMEIDSKYTYRTEIIRKKSQSNPTIASPVILINESFDALVSTNSKMNFKILAPTRLFGNTDIGKIEFNLKWIMMIIIQTNEIIIITMHHRPIVFDYHSKLLHLHQIYLHLMIIIHRQG